MINELLFQALVEAGVDPEIVRENDSGSYKVDTIPSGFQKGKKKLATASMIDWGECISFKCPICEDHTRRAFVSHRWNTRLGNVQFSDRLYKCHNEDCQKTRDMYNFFKGLKLPEDYSTVSVSQDPKKTTKEVKDAQFLIKTEELPWPSYNLSDPRGPQEVVDYLQARNFDITELDKNFGVRSVPAGAEWKSETKVTTFPQPRVLIPVFQHMHLIGWQARSIEAGVKKFKYLFPPGAQKRQWLYNFDTALLYPEVIIFEGVTNVWRTGPDAIACFGKGISADQMTLMKLVWGFDGTGVICFDEDVYEKDIDIRLAGLLNSQRVFPLGTSVLRLRGGDAAVHTCARIRQLKRLAHSVASLDEEDIHVIDEANVPEQETSSLDAPRFTTKELPKMVLSADDDDEDDVFGLEE